MKKIFIFILTLITVTLLFNNKVFCEEPTIYTENYFQYIINDDDDITIVRYYGKESNVVVPRTIGLHTVTEIAKGAFDDTNVKDISIPDTITAIYDTNIEKMNITYYDVFGIIENKEDEPEFIIPKEEDPNKEDGNNINNNTNTNNNNTNNTNNNSNAISNNNNTNNSQTNNNTTQNTITVINEENNILVEEEETTVEDFSEAQDYTSPNKNINQSTSSASTTDHNASYAFITIFVALLLAGVAIYFIRKSRMI